MREGRRSLSGPLTRLCSGSPPYRRTPRKKCSRRSRECITAARGTTSSRSICSSRRRPSRARWSSSTFGRPFHRLAFNMATSIARTLSAAAGGGAAPISSGAAKTCELPHTSRYFFSGGVQGQTPSCPPLYVIIGRVPGPQARDLIEAGLR